MQPVTHFLLLTQDFRRSGLGLASDPIHRPPPWAWEQQFQPINSECLKPKGCASWTTPRNLGIKDTWTEMDRAQDRKEPETDSSERTRFVKCELEGCRSHYLSLHSLSVN